MRFWTGSRHCTAAFCLQVPEKCTHLDLTLPADASTFWYYKNVANSQGGKNHSARCLLLQPCSSAGCMLSACRSHVNHYRTMHSFPHKRIRWNAASWTKFHWESAFVRTIHNPASTLIHLQLRIRTEAHRKTCEFNHSCGVASCSRLFQILGSLLKKNPIFVGLFCTRGKSP